MCIYVYIYVCVVCVCVYTAIVELDNSLFLIIRKVPSDYCPYLVSFEAGHHL